MSDRTAQPSKSDVHEAHVRIEAVALVLTHDVISGEPIDETTALWSIQMLDIANRWLTAAVAA